MSIRFHLYGVLIPDDAARDAEDGTVLFDADDQPITRFRTEQATPPSRCKCSHALTQHARNAGRCYLAACGCATYREKAPQ